MVKDWLFLIVGTEMNYFNFASDQPDSSLHKCLHINKDNSFLWSDEDCTQAKSYICQTGKLKDNAVIITLLQNIKAKGTSRQALVYIIIPIDILRINSCDQDL